MLHTTLRQREWFRRRSGATVCALRPLVLVVDEVRDDITCARRRVARHVPVTQVLPTVLAQQERIRLTARLREWRLRATHVDDRDVVVVAVVLRSGLDIDRPTLEDHPVLTNAVVIGNVDVVLVHVEALDRAPFSGAHGVVRLPASTLPMADLAGRLAGTPGVVGRLRRHETGRCTGNDLRVHTSTLATGNDLGSGDVDGGMAKDQALSNKLHRAADGVYAARNKARELPEAEARQYVTDAVDALLLVVEEAADKLDAEQYRVDL